MDILARIRELQKERGWSNYKMAQKSGLSESGVNNMLRLNRMPSISTLEMICEGFDITMSQFFTETGKPFELSQEESTLLKAWKTLTKDQKKILLELIKSIER